MFGTDHILQIFFADVTFFVAIDEPEECEWVEIGRVGDGLSVWLIGFVDESVFCEDLCEGVTRLNGKHVLLVIGHSRL